MSKDFNKSDLKETLNDENPDDFNYEDKSFINLAIFYTVAASLFFTASAAVMRNFKKDYSDKLAFEFLVFRNIGSIITCASNMKLNDIPITSLTNMPYEKKWLITRIISVSVGNLLWTLTLNNLSLGVASIVMNLAPIFSCYMAYVLVGETIKMKFVVASIVSLLGVYIMSIKSENSNDTNETGNTVFGLICGLVGNISYSYTYISTKVLGNFYEPNQLTLMHSVYGGLGCLVIVFIINGFSTFYVFLKLNFLFYSLTSGFFYAFAYIYTQKAFSLKINIARIVNIFYIEIPFSCIAGFIIYGEVLSLYELFGGIIIVSTILAVNSNAVN